MKTMKRFALVFAMVMGMVAGGCAASDSAEPMAMEAERGNVQMALTSHTESVSGAHVMVTDTQTGETKTQQFFSLDAGTTVVLNLELPDGEYVLDIEAEGDAEGSSSGSNTATFEVEQATRVFLDIALGGSEEDAPQAEEEPTEESALAELMTEAEAAAAAQEQQESEEQDDSIEIEVSVSITVSAEASSDNGDSEAEAGGEAEGSLDLDI